MKRYLATIQYIGRNYCGFQKQKNGLSIQEVIEKALQQIFKKETVVYASGRTDAGVNAFAQTIHFDADTTIPAEKIPLAVNVFLPNDIKFTSTKEVDNNFNARFDVKKKTYIYYIYVSPVQLPVLDQTCYQQKKEPNIEIMKQCAKMLCGTHNYKAFMSAGGQAKTFVRHIYSIKIHQKKEIMSIEVCGNGFLYNMVRIIVGTLLEVGLGKKTIEDVKYALQSQERKNAGYLVPAYGLFLKSVKY